jgi:hypothetical protein
MENEALEAKSTPELVSEARTLLKEFAEHDLAFYVKRWREQPPHPHLRGHIAFLEQRQILRDLLADLGRSADNGAKE